MTGINPYRLSPSPLLSQLFVPVPDGNLGHSGHVSNPVLCSPVPAKDGGDVDSGGSDSRRSSS